MSGWYVRSKRGEEPFVCMTSPLFALPTVLLLPPETIAQLSTHTLCTLTPLVTLFRLHNAASINPNEPSGALEQPTFFPDSDSFCQ